MFFGKLVNVEQRSVYGLPIGVIASIYLNEFVPQIRSPDFIEVHINNLAVVTSIAFRILVLAIFVNVAGFPQSAPIAEGLLTQTTPA